MAGEVLPPFMAALAHMHARAIVHRDIKPENILLTADRTIKVRGPPPADPPPAPCALPPSSPLPRTHTQVADFGLSINCSEERPVTRAGTLDYMSPEVLLCPEKSRPDENKVRPVSGAEGGEGCEAPPVVHLHPSPTSSAAILLAAPPASPPPRQCSTPAAHRCCPPSLLLQEKFELGYGDAVDVWAAGILAYELLVGSPPFERETREETYACIAKRELGLPPWMSDGAANFITKALAKVGGAEWVVWRAGAGARWQRRGPSKPPARVPTDLHPCHLATEPKQASHHGAAAAAPLDPAACAPHRQWCCR